jgi:uncharacterized lipoprotein YbaY/heat shock protein HslJ
MIVKRFLFAFFLASLAVGCKPQDKVNAAGTGAEAPPSTAAVTGTVSYRERMALSPDALVQVSLQDISRADAPAIELARMEISNPGQVPIPFELEYDPAGIDERMTYSVSARITDRGKLIFISDTIAPVLTRGAGNEAELLLVRTDRGAELPEQGHGDSTGMALQGMFRYMADAALFRDCRTGKTYPVSMEGQYIELERAYLNSGIEPGSEVLINIQGRLLERKPMEGNSNIIKLIPDIFNSLDPDNSCTPTIHAELIGTYWRLHELGGKTVTTAEGGKETHVILASGDSRVKGFAGCNSFFGQFESSGDALSFSALGSTMMACPEGMDIEQGFFAALGATTRYRISGLFLELYTDDQLLARLEAVYL